MKVTFDCDTQLDGKELISRDFTFTFESGGMIIEATYSNDSDIFEGEWKAMLKAMQNDESHKIEYCDSNGENSISMTPEQVVFTVSKYGSGGDGLIVIRVPTKYCKDVFQQALKSFN